MKTALLALLVSWSVPVGAAPYVLEDQGGFFPAGRRVEFADRYGWKSYSARFEFDIAKDRRSLTKDSKLTIRIVRRGGEVWEYSCRPKGKRGLKANIHYMQAWGLSVVAECRIDKDDFADAVDLHPDDVGTPNLVFHAMIKDGKVSPGARRGVYIVPSRGFAGSELSAYASAEHDSSELSVVFWSN